MVNCHDKESRLRVLALRSMSLQCFLGKNHGDLIFFVEKSRAVAEGIMQVRHSREVKASVLGRVELTS